MRKQRSIQRRRTASMSGQRYLNIMSKDTKLARSALFHIAHPSGASISWPVAQVEGC